MRAKNGSGITFRSMVSANPHTRKWADEYGTYKSHYAIEEGPPIHESKTCAVHFAVDVQNNKPVAIKVMRNEDQFQNELEARETLSDQNLEGAIEITEYFEQDRCLVMPRGSRSLFEAINTERFAGHDLEKIRHIARGLADSLLELHKSTSRIHGDIKPRNVVRVESVDGRTFSDNKKGQFEINSKWIENQKVEQRNLEKEEKWKLIDLDASAEIGTPSSRKLSSGYCPPELARRTFSKRHQKDQVLADPSIDVWGFGVVLYQMLAGRRLFLVDDANDELVDKRDMVALMNWIAISPELLEPIENNGRVNDWSDDDISAAQDLVRLCLQGNAGDRIDLVTMLNEHPFFATAEKVVEDTSLEGMTTRKKRASTNTVSKHVSWRILSLRRKNLSSLWKRLTKSTDTTRTVYDSTVKQHVIQAQQYHFFLSHMQKEAAGIVKDLYHRITECRCTAWLDMFAEDLTIQGMKRGVESSRYFVLVLTKNVLFRPFCVMELYWAIQHFADKARDQIICVVEVDERFAKWDAKMDVPWKMESLDDSKDSTREIEQQVSIFESKLVRLKNELVDEDYKAAWPSLNAKKKKLDGELNVLRRRIALRELKRDLAKHLGPDPVRNVLDSIETVIEDCRMIPYRRRIHEENGMIYEILHESGFVPPNDVVETGIIPHPKPGASSLVRVLIFCVDAKKSDGVKELKTGIEQSSQFKATIISHKDLASLTIDDFQGLVVFLENGCLNHPDSLKFLNTWCCEERRPFVVVQDGWDFGGVEQSQVGPPVLHDAIFTNTEILPFRAKSKSPCPENPKFLYSHEYDSFIDEFKRRFLSILQRFNG